MALRTALHRLLAPGGVTTVYQPVWHLNGRGPELHAVECLSRGPRGTNFESAKVLFDYARLKRQENLLDRACVATALHGLPRIPVTTRINLNVHASTLGRDDGFLDFIQTVASDTNLPMSRLTIEVVENAPPWDTAKFISVLDRIRGLGAAVALDDVGLGQSNFKMIVDVRPNYLKLDQYFVDGCHSDPTRCAVIESVQQLGRHFGAPVVAEGVENMEDLVTAVRLGISLFQGFLLSPGLTAAEINGGALAAGPRERRAHTPIGSSATL